MGDPSTVQEVRQHVPAKTLGITLPPGYHVLAAGSQLILCFGDAELRGYSMGEDLKQIETDAIRHAARQHAPQSEEPPTGPPGTRDPRTGLPWTTTVSAEAAKLALARELHAICIHLTGLDTLIEVCGYQAPQGVLRQSAQALKWLLNDDDYMTRHSADKLLIFTTRSLEGVETLVEAIHQEIAAVAVEAAGRRLPQSRIGVASIFRVDDPAEAAAFIEALVISAEAASADQRELAAPAPAAPKLTAAARSVESVKPHAPVEPPLPSGASPTTAVAGPTPEAEAPNVPSPPLTAESSEIVASAEPLGSEVRSTPSLSAVPTDAPEAPSLPPQAVEQRASGSVEPVQDSPEAKVIEAADNTQVLAKGRQDWDIAAEDVWTAIDQWEPEGEPSAAPEPTAAPSAESIEQPAPAESPPPFGAFPTTIVEGSTPEAVAPEVPSSPLAAHSPAAVASSTALGLQRKLLGEMLVEAGFITEAQLEEALTEQERTGQLLGRILIARRYISKQLLGQFLKAQRGIPYINLSTRPIDEHLVRSLPEWVIRQHKVLPIARVGDEIHLAMLDPTDVVAMDIVRQFLGARARPFLITKGDFEWARAQFLEMGRQRGSELEQPATAPELTAAPRSAESFEPPAPVEPPLPSRASPTTAVAGPTLEAEAPNVPSPPRTAESSDIVISAEPSVSEVQSTSPTSLAIPRSAVPMDTLEAPSLTPQAIEQRASGSVEPVQVSPEEKVIETADSTQVQGEGRQDGDIAAESAWAAIDQWEAEREPAAGSAVAATELPAVAPIAESVEPPAPDSGEEQRDFADIDLSIYPIDEHLVRSLPEGVILQHKVLPVARVGTEIHLAMLDPTDVAAIDTVGRFLGGRVRPFLMTVSDFNWALGEFFDVGGKVDQSVLEVAPEELEKQAEAPTRMIESPARSPKEHGIEPADRAAQAAAAGEEEREPAAAASTPSDQGETEWEPVFVPEQTTPAVSAVASRVELPEGAMQAEPPLGTVASGSSVTAATGPTPEQSAPDGPSAVLPAESSDAASALPVAARKLLGEMLVEAGLITEAQLREALTVQRQTGERLGQILIERGYISKQTLGQVLEGQRGLAYINLSTSSIDEQLVRSLPEWVILQHKVLPFARVGNEIHLAMLDPTDVVAIDTVGRFLGGRARPFLITEGDFNWALTKFFDIGRKVDQSVLEVAPEEQERRGGAPLTVTESPDGPPVVRVLNSIIHDAVRIGATDIHVEPRVDEASVRFRVDGLLYDKAVLPWGVAESVISRLKVLAGMDIAERLIPQDGRVLLDMEGHEYDLRIATVGTAFGERLAIRLLNPRQLLLGLDRLGLFPEQQEILNRFVLRPHGMILATGPTGSGKTTTLYAALSRVNARTRNIMTIEDPVEYRMAGITQIPVREKTRITFGLGLRAILRQDPDVVMVGEIRDPETASIAIQAALTGHLVFSTLHTNNAAGALVRLQDMGIQPYLLTSSVLAVVGQRLIRVLCPACKRQYQPSPAELQTLGLPADKHVRLFGPVGCPDCDNLGYKGRTGVFEIMVMDDTLRELVLQRKPASALMEAAKAAGMHTLRDAAIRKVLDGVVSIDELQRLISFEVT